MTKIVFVTGYAGSGKSELSKILAEISGWALIDKDTLTRPFVDSMLVLKGSHAGDRESDTYLQNVRPLEYQSIEAVIEENLNQGVSIIATAPWIGEFDDESYWEDWRFKADLIDAAIVVVWVKSDIETMSARVISRNARRDEYKIAHWAAYAAELNIDLGSEIADYVVDNSSGGQPLAEQAQNILSQIQED